MSSSSVLQDRNGKDTVAASPKKRKVVSEWKESNYIRDVAEFHATFRHPILKVPQIPSKERCALRVSLIEEELGELRDAIKENDLIEVADALCDIQYVLSGAVCEFGMASVFKDMFEEVHRSNMSKMCRSDAEVQATLKHYRENKGMEGYVSRVSEGEFLVRRKSDNKVLKSVNYSPASLKPFIERKTFVTPKEFESPSGINLVAEFHRKFQAPVLDAPQIPAAKRCELRVSLIREELNELKDAIMEKDLIEIADALCDIQYVLSGAICEFGMTSVFKSLFDEVQRSNMSKMCKTAEEAEETVNHYKVKKSTEGYVTKIADGEFLVLRKGDDKVLKSVRYSPADLKPIILGRS
eukprot:g946.t1